MTQLTLPPLMVAPAQVVRGSGIVASAGNRIAALGQRPLLVGGQRALAAASAPLSQALKNLAVGTAPHCTGCSEAMLKTLHGAIAQHSTDVIIGVGGGKALDTAKLLAHQAGLPVVTIPTSAATCAAWTALSNVYSDEGAFLYDVALDRCPDLLLLDYGLVATAPQRTLVAGIGDALAKWYEASVSSGASEQALIVAAVQQARVLRDLLFQKTPAALADPNGAAWQEVVDACVLLAGVIGGLGGAQCRTVAAHAVHNGLTHVKASQGTLHGEKVAYGILVQLRLEEMHQKSSLAQTARRQLIQFYDATGLPKALGDLGMAEVSLRDLQRAAEIACCPGSDIHHLPFVVTPELLAGALVSTTAPELRIRPVAGSGAEEPVLPGQAVK